MFYLLENLAKLTLTLVLGYLAIRWFATRRNLSGVIDKYRMVILLLLAAFAIALKVTEEVIGGRALPVDREILLWIHAHTSPAVVNFFSIVTLTGSWKFLVPLAGTMVCVFAFLRKRWEAVFLVISMAAGTLLTWGLKALVGRERPALWLVETYYSGLSFPSGHTLDTTCCAVASLICVRRIWPHTTKIAAIVAISWPSLVGISRMVLGVHFLTDVIAAGCLGLIVPCAVRFFFWPGRLP